MRWRQICRNRAAFLFSVVDSRFEHISQDDKAVTFDLRIIKLYLAKGKMDSRTRVNTDLEVRG